ncbi:uncharacterized protein N7529_003270 [Penicillium soppii]|uniref:uncharacterized protein n=1 Tax=Penicillium soppii TaxID=69789 RepID=UPI0025471FAD|nr:uncharacterized protein N7529_003270 [Penicillium soppii]KAJ5874840.1 hypothetical protein N7529_003270 [Penicillium soppii]
MPILHALAEVAVMELFANWITAQFSDIPIDFTVRHGLAAISKGVVLQYTQKSFANLPEQCGAKGLATEILLGRYNFPKATKPNSLIAKHEEDYIAELVKLQEGIHERTQKQSDRMAYEAAVNMGIDFDLLALYEAGLVKTDSSWYVEHLGLNWASRLNWIARQRMLFFHGWTSFWIV